MSAATSVTGPQWYAVQTLSNQEQKAKRYLDKFIEIEEMLFGERSQLLVDPSEEKLKTEFAGVKRSYIPLQSVIRIDEVEKEGAVKVTDTPSEPSGAKVARFPMSGVPPFSGGADE